MSEYVKGVRDKMTFCQHINVYAKKVGFYNMVTSPDSNIYLAIATS